MRSLADIIAFNEANAERALRFGQDIFLAAEATRGDLREPEYRSARAMDLRASRTPRRSTPTWTPHRLDAVLFPGTAGAAIAAKAGLSERPGAGRLHRRRRAARRRPTIPLGATFAGRAWSEPRCCCASPTPSSRASQSRRIPPGLPALAGSSC